MGLDASWVVRESERGRTDDGLDVVEFRLMELFLNRLVDHEDPDPE